MDQIDVMFTGHRPPKLGGYDEENPTAKEIKKWLETQVGFWVLKGDRTFVSGGALGTDQWGAEAVIETRKAYPHVKLVMAIPCDGYNSTWPDESKKRFQDILDAADEVNIICPGDYKAYKNTIRDQWMVDRANRCIAVFDGTKRGTGQTVKMAKKKGIPIIRLDPRLIGYPEGGRVRLVIDDPLKRGENGEMRNTT